MDPQIDLTDDERNDLRYSEETERFIFVADTHKMIEKRRWYTLTSRIYIHKETKHFYRFLWDDPNTESQEYEPSTATMQRVFAKVVVKPEIVYLTRPTK